MKKLILAVAALAALLPATLSCKKAETFKVISYNIRLGTANDGDNAWENRKEATTAMLVDQDPLIFGVQEAMKNQLDYITENCPQYACVGVGREDGIEMGDHMSIFYKKDLVELEKWGTYWLSETPEEPSKGWDAACRRTATWALLKIKETGKEFFFVNTHLDHRGPEARKNGLALILDRIADMNPDDWPMILTGDLNVEPDDPCLTNLNTRMNSARAFAEKTTDKASFNGWGTAQEVIDYVYYSGFSKCLAFDVIDQTYAEKPYISDHYPVHAILQF